MPRNFREESNHHYLDRWLATSLIDYNFEVLCKSTQQGAILVKKISAFDERTSLVNLLNVANTHAAGKIIYTESKI